MLRLSQVAKLLQQPVSKVTNDLVIKGNGRHLIVYNQEVYSFPSTKNVIIPFDLAAKYAKISHQKKIHPPRQLSDLLKPLDKTELGRTKHSIAVLLGHFNHGKTTLLDTLINYTNSSKNSDLVSEEKHGITQEVRTKSIQIAGDHYLTLIDTPGQEIFYRMRNHGAAVADIGLLLISMADGICRQTEESIGILESLRIPVVVCLNKLDLLPQKTEEERQERVRQFIEECKVFKALDSPSATFVPISAKNSIHIDKLIQEIERVSSIIKSSGKRIKGIKHEYLTGKGYVLNIIHDRYSGQTLHIVMTAGSMKVGDYFVAGGWSGRVKLIVTTNDDELLRVSSNSSTTGDNDENLIRKGIAVKLTASFHPDIGNPRPLGDDIYFFSGRNHPDITTNKDMKKLQDKLKEETEYFMDQNFMLESFESHHLSEEERDRLKINKTLSNQKGLTPFYKHVLSLQPSLKEDESSEEEVESDESEDDDTPLPPKGLVIIKASSDIEISTIHDVYEDELNAAAKIPSSREGKHKKFGPKKIIFSGVGQLSFKDTELARLGQATLLCYNVGIDKLALQNLKSHSLKVAHFERVQDVLDYLFDRKTVDT